METDWGNVIAQAVIGLIALGALWVAIDANVIARRAPKIQRQTDLRSEIRNVLEASIAEIDASRREANAGKFPSQSAASLAAASELERLADRDHGLGKGKLNVTAASLQLFVQRQRSFELYETQIQSMNLVLTTAAARADPGSDSDHEERARNHRDQLLRARNTELTNWGVACDEVRNSVLAVVEAINKMDG